MKTAALLTTSALLSGLAVAQETVSKPFNLLIQSDNKDVNGKFLTACHTGAAIESLCLTDSKTPFNLRTYTGATSPIPGIEPSGSLTYDLPTTPPETEYMSFYVDPTTNVALPLFMPGPDNQQQVAFDKRSLLTILGYVDDTITPPNYTDPKPYYNWYVCQTYYVGYTYRTLNWALGKGKPQNPSCVKVDVKRKYT